MKRADRRTPPGSRRMMSRRAFLWVGVAGGAASLLACTSAPTTAVKPEAPPAVTSAPAAAGKAAGPASEKLAALHQAAKGEGALVWSQNQSEERVKPVAEAFQKQYPGIEVTIATNEPTTIGGKIVQEVQAKRVTTDAVRGSATQILIPFERDALMPLNLGELGVNDTDVRFDGRVVWGDDVIVGWVYNTRLVQDAEVPKTWDDLLDPKLKGKIAVIRSAAGFDQLNDVWTPDQISAYLKKLATQDITQVATPLEGLNRVAAGESLISNAAAIDLAAGLMASQKAPLALAPISPVSLTPAVLGVPQGAPHPNAGRLFCAWLVSDEGKAALVKAGTGRHTDCGPLPMSQMMCGKNISTAPADTPEKLKRNNDFRQQMLKDLGFAQ